MQMNLILLEIKDMDTKHKTERVTLTTREYSSPRTDFSNPGATHNGSPASLYVRTALKTQEHPDAITGAPGHHTARTQEHPDAITPQGPRSTRTPSHRKDPGAPGRHHTARTQEHLDAITPQGPRSTRTPSHHKDPGAPGHHHTTRTQEHPDTFTTQATRWDPGTPDTIRLGGPRCNQTILDQENPEVPQTSLDQEIPEAPIIL
ncbi:hypothetical protein STEG23_025389 [Scotinomys teguina]